MLAKSLPADGEAVVRRECRDSKFVYVLYGARGPDHYVLHTREESLAQALTFARRQGVRAWFTNGGGSLVPWEKAATVRLDERRSRSHHGQSEYRSKTRTSENIAPTSQAEHLPSPVVENKIVRRAFDLCERPIQRVTARRLVDEAERAERR